MYTLYRDPQGESVTTGVHSSTPITLPSPERQYETRYQSDSSDTVEMLRNQVKDLQAALSSLSPNNQSSMLSEERPAATQQQSLNTAGTLTTTAD